MTWIIPHYVPGYPWTLPHTAPQTGWLCPKCNAGVAPWVARCPGCTPVQTTITTTGLSQSADESTKESSK